MFELLQMFRGKVVIHVTILLFEKLIVTSADVISWAVSNIAVPKP